MDIAWKESQKKNKDAIRLAAKGGESFLRLSFELFDYETQATHFISLDDEKL